MTLVGARIRCRLLLSSLLLCLVVLGPLTGCVSQPRPAPSPAPLVSRSVQPSAFLTVIDDADAAANAHAMSAALFDRAAGRSDFLGQALQYQSLLELSHVGLVLDPEWRLGPTQRHLAQIGSVDVAEINAVLGWLATLTRERAYPQKLLVLHQFRSSMIGNRALLDVSHPEIGLLIHVDRRGSQLDKQATWVALHVDAPAGVACGWKNFYEEDTPTLSPEQTKSEVVLARDLVTYQ